MERKYWTVVMSVFQGHRTDHEVLNRYKVTKGLLDRFGSKRVIDSPITESGFCGLTVGAALAGLHPVVSNLLTAKPSLELIVSSASL